MANANHAEKNRLRSFGGVLFTPQANCPIAAGGVGLWLDGNGVFKLRNADGSDTATASETPNTRVIATTAPLTGGGDLSADRTLGISTAAATNGGAPNAAKAVVLDGAGKLAGRVVEADGARLDSLATAPQIVNGPGPIDVVARTTFVRSNGPAQAQTLPNGVYVGQRKSIVLNFGGGGNTAVISPANFELNTITLSAMHDAIELEWNGAVWRPVMLGGTASVA